MRKSAKATCYFKNVWAEEGFSTCQANMFESEASGSGDNLNQFGGGEVIGLRGPTAVSGRATVETAFVALIGEGNT